MQFGKRRQLYGGREADERRPNAQVYEDAIRDMEIAEGEDVQTLHNAAQAFCQFPNEENKRSLAASIDNLRAKGHSKARVESIITRAMSNVSIPDPKRIVPQPSARCLRRRARKTQK